MHKQMELNIGNTVDGAINGLKELDEDQAFWRDAYAKYPDLGFEYLNEVDDPELYFSLFACVLRMADYIAEKEGVEPVSVYEQQVGYDEYIVPIEAGTDT